MYVVEFEVSGKGSFPFDMLRYDCCYPADTDAVLEMLDALDRQTPSSIHTVKLRCRVNMSKRDALKSVSERKLPCCARWASFGWEVVTARVIF